MTPSGKAKLACVIGWPAAHSLSPRLHGYWLNALNIDGAYVPLSVAPADFAQVVRTLPKMGFRGFNVTVPHKEEMFRLADRLDRNAERIGAVNTVVIGEAGRLLGSNTDAYGFLENLRHGAHGALKDYMKKSVVLGAGGAARAVLAALIDEGCMEIVLINRTRERAEEMARAYGGPVQVAAWEERTRALDGATMLVNTTTLGMEGHPPLDLALDLLPTQALVTDLVYAPLETPLLRQARARGHKTVDGLGMLLWQARPGFKAWFGVEPEITDALRRHVLAGRDA